MSRSRIKYENQSNLPQNMEAKVKIVEMKMLRNPQVAIVSLKVVWVWSR